MVESELGRFNPELLERPRWVVGSKLDAAVAERREELAAAAKARGLSYREISAVTGDGTRELMRELEAALAAGGVVS